jgi:hypothetical protein
MPARLKAWKLYKKSESQILAVSRVHKHSSAETVRSESGRPAFMPRENFWPAGSH